MLNVQLQRLNRSMLEHLHQDRDLLVTEELDLRRKKLEKICPGDWIDLGESPLQFYIRRGKVRLYRARIGAGERGGKLLIEGSIREDSLPEPPRKKRVILEGRIAVLPSLAKEGERVEFPWTLGEHILLFEGERAVAEARLISYDGGYALEIVECSNEA